MDFLNPTTYLKQRRQEIKQNSREYRNCPDIEFDHTKPGPRGGGRKSRKTSKSSKSKKNKRKKRSTRRKRH